MTLTVVPYFVGLESLEKEHFESVFGYGTLLASILEEKRLVRVVDEVVADVILREDTVGNVGTFVHVRIHSERSGIDNHRVFGDDGAG